MAFAREFFRKEVSEAGEASLGAHLRQAAKALGKDPEKERVDPETDCPEGGEFVWAAFVQLSSTRPRGWGPGPITFAEVLAWQHLRNLKLETWELDALRQMDSAYLEEADARQKRDAKKSKET